MNSPTDNELLLIGLRTYENKLKKLVDKDIEQYSEGLMTLDALVFSLDHYNAELKKTFTRIEIASPEIDRTFAADDIPF